MRHFQKTVYRYLHEYRESGIEKLKEVNFHRRQSQLVDYRASIEADFRQRPPATVAEATVRIAQLTGLQRGPTQVRQFLKAVGMKPRKVGQILPKRMSQRNRPSKPSNSSHAWQKRKRLSG